MAARVSFEDRFASDGRREEKAVGAFEGEKPSCLEIPLVPADGDAEVSAFLRLEDLEARVARAEVELLLVALSGRDVALAIETEILAVLVETDEGIVVAVSRSFEEGDGKDDG